MRLAEGAVNPALSLSWTTARKSGPWCLPMAKTSLSDWREEASEEEVGFKPVLPRKIACCCDGFRLTCLDFCRTIRPDYTTTRWISEGHSEEVPWRWTDPESKWRGYMFIFVFIHLNYLFWGLWFLFLIQYLPHLGFFSTVGHIYSFLLALHKKNQTILWTKIDLALLLMLFSCSNVHIVIKTTTEAHQKCCCLLPFILKELIQNAEDAGASEVKFMYDETEYGVESLWSPDMAQHQGEAVNKQARILFFFMKEVTRSLSLCAAKSLSCLSGRCSVVDRWPLNTHSLWLSVLQARHCTSTMTLCSLWRTGTGSRRSPGAGREKTLWKLDDLGSALIPSTMLQVRILLGVEFLHRQLFGFLKVPYLLHQRFLAVISVSIHEGEMTLISFFCVHQLLCSPSVW